MVKERLLTTEEQIALENKNDILTDVNDLLKSIWNALKSIFYACIVGTILGSCVVGAMIIWEHYVVPTIFSIWNVKWWIIFIASVVYIMVQIVKIHAGFNTRRN